MSKQHRYRPLILAGLALVGSIALSLTRMSALKPLITSLQSQFPEFNIQSLLVMLIVLGTLVNVLFQGWILLTICKITKIKTQYLNTVALISYAIFGSLIVSQPFVTHPNYPLISGAAVTVFFLGFSMMLFRRVNPVPFVIYGVLLGALQVWVV